MDYHNKIKIKETFKKTFRELGCESDKSEISVSSTNKQMSNLRRTNSISFTSHSSGIKHEKIQNQEEHRNELGRDII